MALGEGLGQAVLELVTDGAKLQRGLAAARAETLQTLTSTQQRLQAVGSQISATGSKMTVGLTAPVIGLGKAIFDVGGGFQHTMSEIVGLVGVGREQVNAWRPEIERIAEATGVGPDALAKALYFVASSGLDAGKAMGVLELSAKAAEAGMGDVEVIAGVLTSALNAYQKTGLTAAEATDTLTQAIRVGAAEPADMAAAIGTVAPAAAQLNVKFSDLLGTMAVLSRVNKNVAEDSTSLGQIFATLLKPTAQTADALKGMGLSAAELRQELAEHGLMAMLRLLASHLGDDDEAIAKIFPNIRALRGVLNLTGQDAKLVDEAMAKVTDSTGALGEAVNAVADDAETLTNQSLARMQNDLVNLGDDVLPLVVELFDKLAGGVHDAATWFEKLPPDVKSTVVQGAALLAVIGPILVILGSLVGAVGGVIGVGATLAGFLTATLIPALVGLATAVLSVGIEALATAIFATGIPALQGLAVALLGVQTAGAPILILFAAIGAAVALMSIESDANMKSLVRDVADLEEQGKLTAKAWDDATIAAAAGSGKSATELRTLVDAQEAADKATRSAAEASWMAAVASHAAAEHAGEQAAQQKAVDKAYHESGQAAVDYEKSLHDALDKAFTDEQEFTTDTLGEIQKFRKGLESAFAATEDAATDAATTQYKITIAQGELAKMEADYTKHHKTWTAEQLAQWKLQHLGAVKELAELKYHAGLIGTAMQQEQTLTAELTSKGMKAGLTSKFPEIKAAYEALRDDNLTALWQLAQKGGAAGKAAATELKKWLDPTNPASPLHNAAIWGGKTAAEWVAALAAEISGSVSSGGAISTALSRVRAHMQATSPPGPLSPLHHIGLWGHRTGLEYVSNFAAGILAGIPMIDGALLRLAPAGLSTAAASGFARNVPTLPQQASDVARQAVTGGRRGGNTYIVNVNGNLEARNPAEVRQTIQRLEALAAG